MKKQIKTVSGHVARFGVAASLALWVATVSPPAHAAFPFLQGVRTLIADSAELLGLYIGLLVVIIGICIGVYKIGTGQGDGFKTMLMALGAGIILGGLVQLATYAYGLGGGGGITI
ncbi:hypothetical protein JL101_036575 (plasmid) [Skermanella rosea]|uniref:hypothetical protein n=1 Tax=Skermanella rosea TaxID=1817965 RepID=UPI001931781B|nr:hypothetical protein [Skermanella rosea]UEM08216.1 hypothetical protein JL101_036575 [Skermanella rosea]